MTIETKRSLSSSPSKTEAPAPSSSSASEMEAHAPLLSSRSEAEGPAVGTTPESPSAQDRVPHLRDGSIVAKVGGSATEPARIHKNPLLPWLTYLLLMPLIALATIAFGCVSLLAGLWDSSGRQQHAIARAWAKVLLLISLSPVTLIGVEKLHEHETAVYVSNHLSYYDTPVLFAKLPFQFRILAKQSLWKIPFIGWYLNRSGQVPVDAKSARSAIASLNRGVSTLKAGLPLVLFPEGGRAANGETQPFVSGAAYMAIKAQLPIIPLTLVGTYELLPIHTYHLKPRPLLVVAGDPIPTTGLITRDADALTQRVRDVITATYLQYN